MFPDLGNTLDKTCRQVELAALPVAGQVLRAFLDRTVALDDAGTGDADERRKLESLLVRFRNQVLEELDETLYRLLAARLIIRMTPSNLRSPTTLAPLYRVETLDTVRR